jgi:glycosyltransferase involved in cell wall biosynthesis
MSEASADRPVLHLVPALFDAADGIVGGAERYAFELARHMSNVVPTRLVTFGQHARDERLGSLDLRVIAGAWHVRGQRSNQVSWALVGEVWRARVVHCHQQHVVASSFAAVLARMFRRGVFCTDLGGGGWDVSAYVSTDRWYHGHLHISEYSRKIAGHGDAPWARVVLGGVDSERFSPGETGIEKSTVLFVGRMLPHKGITDLIDALDPETPAEILGTTPHVSYFEELRARARGKRVEFRLDCHDAELVKAYRRARCVVLPSVYRDFYGGVTPIPELLGQTLLEAMACAVPVVCTDVASLPEIVEHGITGLVVPPNDPQALGDAIRWLIANPTQAMSMGSRGRDRVLARFSWDAVVQRCLLAYESSAAS